MMRRLILIYALLVATQVGAAAELPRDVVLVDSGSSQYRFEVEIADDPGERAEGLMHRRSLPDNAGMLFLYPRPQPVQFWMKDTPLSLDIVFVRADGTIARIVEAATPLSEQLIPSGEPVRAVLEVKAGTMRQLGITAGDRLRHATFFP